MWEAVKVTLNKAVLNVHSGLLMNSIFPLVMFLPILILGIAYNYLKLGESGVFLTLFVYVFYADSVQGSPWSSFRDLMKGLILNNILICKLLF